MVKINLLGNNTAIDHSGKVMLIGYIGLVAVTLLICIIVTSGMKSQIVEMELRERTLKAQLQNLDNNTREVSDLEIKRKTLQNKLALIAKLKKNTTGPVRVMDDLNGSLIDKVWLLEVQEEKGLMKAKGRALTNQDIANFMNNLEQSDFFENVDLVDSQTMYYSKETGAVTGSADVNALSQGADRVGGGRATKSNKNLNQSESSFQVSDDKTKGDIKIKEFIIAAKVNYIGKLVLAAKVPELVEANKKVENKGKNEP